MVFSDSDSLAIVEFAIELARDTGALLQQRPENLHISTKSTATDVVTQMDQQAEKFIVSRLQQYFPHDSVVGEEGAFIQGTSQFQWVIDPLDGTINYLYNLPAWSVSIARVNIVSGVTQVGVVEAPELARTFWGRHGHGAKLEHGGMTATLHVSDCSDLAQALIGTGFGYRQDRRAGQARVLNTVLPMVRDIRRLGSCAIDLCLVAQGVLDGFYERGVNPWDHSAGALIARESGAVVSGLHGTVESDEMIVVANPAVHQQLVKALESINADSDSSAQ